MTSPTQRDRLPALLLIMGALWPAIALSESAGLDREMKAIIFGQQVLNAFENRQWDVLRRLAHESRSTSEIEQIERMRAMYGEQLHISLARREWGDQGCQDRWYAIRSGIMHGRMHIQACLSEGEWRWTFMDFSGSPFLTATFMFEIQIADMLGVPVIYFACEDDRQIELGDVLRCEAGLANRETFLLGFKLREETMLEVVIADVVGEPGPPSKEQLISAARSFLQPLVGGDFDAALRHASMGFADTVSRLSLREIGRDLGADRGRLQEITQVGEQLNPGYLPPRYLFRLDFERSSVKVELDLVAGENSLKVHAIRAGEMSPVALARLIILSVDPDPHMSLACPEIDIGNVGQEFSCQLELWGQSMDATVVVRENQSIDVTMSPNLSARLARQLAGSEHMLGWTFSRVNCTNNRPASLETVYCNVDTSEGEKKLAVIYRGDTLRITDIVDID